MTAIALVFALSGAACGQNNLTESNAKMNAFSRTVLSTNGSTRATGYEMSTKIITANGKVFVAWLDRVSDTQVRTLDLKSGRWSETVLVGTGLDNHGGPAMTLDSGGYLYLVFGPHHGPFQFCRSRRPYDATEWDKLPEFGDHATYPSLVCGPDDTLHCTYRGGPAPWRLMYQQRPAGGDWTAPRELVHPGVPDGYTQYGNSLAVGLDGTLHLVFHVYDMHPAAGKAAGYLRSRDGGSTWETAAGKSLELPATLSSPCFLEQDAGFDMRVGNVAVDAEGHPWLTVSHGEAKPTSVTLWHHDGVKWIARPLLPEVAVTFPGKQMAWHGCLTFDGAGTLYVAAVREDPPGGWGHPSQEVVLLTSRDRGVTFDVTQLSATDPAFPSWLPNLERPFGAKPLARPPGLLYTHGGPGAGVTEGAATEVVFVRLDANQ